MRTRVKKYYKRSGIKVRRHMRRIHPSPEFVEYVPMALKKEGRVAIKNIGILKVKKTKARPSRVGINPFTKEKMTFKQKPAGKKIKFFASKTLKEAVL